jgi:uncharacterized coiled-coil DUF342 family protein
MPPEDDQEIERLLKLIDKIARIDTKLDDFCKQYIDDLTQLRKECDEMKRTSDKLREEHDILKDLFVKLQVSYDKWKWIWRAIAVVVTPIITSIVIFVIHTVWGF